MGSPLDPDHSERGALTEEVFSFLTTWFDRLGTLEASGVDLDPDILTSLRHPPPEDGRSLEQVLADLDVANRPGIYHAAGGHMSYIPNGGLYTAALAEFLGAGLNRYTGVTAAAPGLAAIEHGVIDWMLSLFGLGPSASGLLLSGGSMANLTAIVAARTALLGNDLGNGVIYVTRHTHHSTSKAARLAGFRPDQIVEVSVDADLRMDPEDLRARVEADRQDGRRPFMVVGSAGTTDTGTVDPLVSLAEIASSESLWFHVDAAYGGFFQLTERGRAVLSGLERADSMALDPHKGLSIPFGVGALLVREEETLVDAHEGRGAYLKEEDTYMGLRDIASLGPELTRPSRGLTVWLPLHVHGVRPFRQALDRNLDLAGYAYQRLTSIEGIETPWLPDLSIVAVRFADDDLGRAAMQAVNDDRTVHLSPTTVEGRFVLRFAFLNHRSTTEHVDRAIEIIEKTLVG